MALGVLLAVLVSAPAHAAYPGQSGKVVFFAGDLHTRYLDGSGSTQLTSGCCQQYADPTWSPDGTRIAYSRSTGDPDGPWSVWVMNADGSAQTMLASSGLHPTWSPDATRIAFTDLNGIWVMDADGTDAVEVRSSGRDPAWSPDGTKIAFAQRDGSAARMWLMNPDGSSAQQILALAPPSPGHQDYRLESPSWAPDRSRIAFAAVWEECVQTQTTFCETRSEIHTVKPDGTNHQQLTPPAFFHPSYYPDGYRILMNARAGGMWSMRPDGSDVAQVPTGGRDGDVQPITGTTGHVRPKGATPLKTSLVPAYANCIDPDRTHGPPLAEGSCSAPDPLSDHATVGTPDSNGQPAKFAGFVLLGVVRGDPSTPTDEADVAIHASITDVRSTATLADYAGELRASAALRVADKDNTGGASGPEAATGQDTTLAFTIPCTPTADTTVGATCDLSTTADALVPGQVKEKQRAVWQLDQVRVHDGGTDADADTAPDNTLFAVQGLFVP